MVDTRRYGMLLRAAPAATRPGFTEATSWMEHWLMFHVITGETMSSASRAIELVGILTNPRNTQYVHDASEELQRIQHSVHGWQAADAMLASEYDDVRFYGALTWQIKLNREGAALDPDVAVEILARILAWIVRLANQGERAMVLNKLCSTLSTYFIKSPVRWMKAVRQVVCSLYAERVVPNDELNSLPSTAELFSQLLPSKQLIVVRFCQTLAEDMFNWANISHQHTVLDDTFGSNTVHATAVMSFCLGSSTANYTELTVEAFSCFSAWVIYAHNNWLRDLETLKLLQDLTTPATSHILSTTDELREAAVEFFTSNIDFRLKFFERQHLDLISQLVRQRIGPECVRACASGEQEPEMVALCKLLTSYGKTTIKDVVAVRKNNSSQEIIGIFLDLLTGPGFAAEDDEMILSATEFWSDYAEHVVYVTVSSESDALNTWLPPVRDDLLQALERFLAKLTPPSSEIIRDWDDDMVEQFKHFRENVSDFLEFVTEIPDTNLLKLLVSTAMQVLPTKQWLVLEGVLHCINAIADSVSPTSDDLAMNALMGSSIFSDASDVGLNVPVLLRRAVLRLIDGYSSFIKSNTAYIPPVLTFLFTTLATTLPNEAKVADLAAKSFESLCSSCRRSLTPHLGELLQQCPQALSGPSINAYQKEKVMAAFASIIQALPSEEEKAAPLLALIEVIEKDLNAAIEAIHRGDQEQGEILGTGALQCLASIGKGIQAPDDLTIDLDSDTEGDSMPTAPSSQAFWTAEAGAAVQQRILGCFEIVSYLQDAGDALDAACCVLRAGLAETQPGPFVFPPSTTVAFISKANLNTPRIETILSTACSFVSAHSRRSTAHLFDEILAVYQCVARIMGELGDPSNDPQLAQMCMDFLHRLLAAYVDVMLAPNDEDIAVIMNFAVKCLTGTAPMLKRNACNFFETLIGHGRPNNPTPLPPTRVPISTVIVHFAPLIATAILHQVSGVAQRSELDSLSKPLRAFVFSVPNSRKYLEDALLSNEEAFVTLAAGNRSVGASERRSFVARVVQLRGAKQTNVVVREFWAKCKGTVSTFE